jgi:hypothetical protein
MARRKEQIELNLSSSLGGGAPVARERMRFRMLVTAFKTKKLWLRGEVS